MNNVNALLQGQQDISQDYPLTLKDDRAKRDDGTTALKVKILDIQFTFMQGFPTGVIWNINLIEASPNS